MSVMEKVDNNDMRVIEDLNEIYRMLAQLKGSDIAIQISQLLENSISVQSGKITGLDFHSKFEVEVTLDQEDLARKLSSQERIKLHSFHRGLTIDTEFKLNKRGNIIISIPEFIECIETRKEPRFRFDKKKLEIEFSFEDSSGQIRRLQKQIIDISRGGLSFYINDEEAKLFQIGRLIHIRESSGPIKYGKGVIRYVGNETSANNMKEKTRVGVEFTHRETME